MAVFFNFNFIFRLRKDMDELARSTAATLANDFRHEFDNLVNDPRTQFALDLLDPRMFGAVVTVPKEFPTVLSNQHVDYRNFWGAIDGHMTIALGVHHGVDAADLAETVRNLAFCSEATVLDRTGILLQLLKTLGADSQESQRLVAAVRGNKYSPIAPDVPAVPVLSVRSNPLKTIAASMLIRHYLRSVDVAIYSMALQHLMATLNRIARLRTFIIQHNDQFLSSVTSTYFKETFKADSRWEQTCKWVRARANIPGTDIIYLANPFDDFAQTMYDTLPFGRPVFATNLLFVKRPIWKALAHGQFDVVELDREAERKELHDGLGQTVCLAPRKYAWANDALASERECFARRNLHK